MKTSLLLILFNLFVFVLHVSTMTLGLSTYLTIFAGAIFAFIIEFAIRYVAYKKLDTEYISKKLTTRPSLWWLPLSPGYFFSNLYKQKICETFNKRQLKADLVRDINDFNLMASIIIFSLSTLFTFAVSHDNPRMLIINILIGLTSFRTLSRCCEIIYAFVKDVLDESNYTSTSLNKFDRVKLAINSYIENIFNFATLYYAFTPTESTMSNLFTSLGRSTISNVQPAGGDNLINIAIYGQVITSLVLIVLSLAVYVGRKK